MRVKFFLKPAEPINVTVPLDFRRYFISFLKTLLSDSPFYARFNEEKPGYSPYVFGVNFGKITNIDKSQKTITVEPPVTMVFSTGLFDLMTDVCNSAINIKGSPAILGLNLDSIQLLPYKTIRSNLVEFKLVGHGVLRTRDRYLEPDDKKDELEEAMNTHLQAKLAFLSQYFPELSDMVCGPLKIIDFSGLRKGVCFHYGGEITTLQGSVVLGGDPQCLQFIYDYGFGVRSGQGFGLLEVRRQL